VDRSCGHEGNGSEGRGRRKKTDRKARDDSS